MKRNWFYWLIGILLLIKISNLSSSEILNKRAKNFSLLDLKENVVDTSKLSNKSILYLFFDPSNTFHKEVLVYAKVLSNKYKSLGLEIIGVTDKNKEKALKLLEHGKFNFPIIFDFKKELYNFFLAKECCGGVVLVGRDGLIKFHSSILLNQENIRQLVEKEVLGIINYEFKEPVGQKLFQIGIEAPKLSLREAHTGKIKDFWSFEEEYLIVTFFSSVCGMCKSGRRIETLKELDRRLKEKRANAKIILVFSEPFDGEDIANWEKRIKMPFEKYISEDIFTDEEKYLTDSSLKTDPLTVVLDRGRVTVSLEEKGAEEKVILGNVISFFLSTKENK